jgi:signal transduction histidine kinase
MLAPVRHPVRWLKDHPFAADSLVAMVIAGVAIPALYVHRPGYEQYRQPNALAVVLVLASALPLAWRRRFPLAVLAATGTLAIVLEAANYPPSTAGVPVLIALYTVTTRCPRRVSIRAGVATAVGILIALLVTHEKVTASDVIENVVVFGAAWMLGDRNRVRQAYLAHLETRADQLEREREVNAARAVADERTRIARELHDVIAHNVSVMVVQAGAARRTLDRDTDGAREAMEYIESTGRQALDEMRRLLGVLRQDGDPVQAALTPQPSVRHLDQLVAQVREAGLPVDLEVEGEPQPLASGVDLSAYRIVQEALTNSLKHAGPAHATVHVRYGKSDVELTVSDDGRGPRPPDSGNGRYDGHGLVGMRERVALFGGELEVGPRRGGGFEVRARLPVARGRL